MPPLNNNDGATTVFYSFLMFLVIIISQFIMVDTFEEWSHGKVVIESRAKERPATLLETLDDLSVAVTWKEAFPEALQFLCFIHLTMMF